MIYPKFNCVLFVFFLSIQTLSAQDTAYFSLQEAIALAKENSLDAKIAKNSARFSYWNYQNFKSSFLPKLSLSGTLPNYFRSVNSITLPNGEYNFVDQEIASSNVSIDLSQNIGLTGGRISMSSNLARIDNFRSSNIAQTSYSAAPYLFSYYQNSFFYNEYRWQKRIQLLKYEEAQKEYRERQEEIASNTVDKYFSLLIAQTQLKLDRQNIQNLDTVLKITNARVERGLIDLNILLQTKVNFFNVKKSLASAQLQLEIARQDFIKYLKLSRDLNIKLTIPDQGAVFEINPDDALIYAQSNRKSIIAFQRRRLEAQQAIAKTKAETGPSVSFRTDFGASHTGAGIGTTYASRSLPRQSVAVGFSVPLVDWGVNKSNRKRAEANWELEQSKLEQEDLAIEQEIFLHTMKWNMTISQATMVKETSMLAQQYYNIEKQRYTIGSISLAEFNNAQLEKDKAILDHLDNLQNYWSSYYLMRKLTLYDFLNKKPIDSENYYDFERF